MVEGEAESKRGGGEIGGGVVGVERVERVREKLD